MTHFDGQRQQINICTSGFGAEGTHIRMAFSLHMKRRAGPRRYGGTHIDVTFSLHEAEEEDLRVDTRALTGMLFLFFRMA